MCGSQKLIPSDVSRDEFDDVALWAEAAAVFAFQPDAGFDAGFQGTVGDEADSAGAAEAGGFDGAAGDLTEGGQGGGVGGQAGDGEGAGGGIESGHAGSFGEGLGLGVAGFAAGLHVDAGEFGGEFPGITRGAVGVADAADGGFEEVACGITLVDEGLPGAAVGDALVGVVDGEPTGEAGDEGGGPAQGDGQGGGRGGGDFDGFAGDLADAAAVFQVAEVASGEAVEGVGGGEAVGGDAFAIDAAEVAVAVAGEGGETVVGLNDAGGGPDGIGGGKLGGSVFTAAIGKSRGEQGGEAGGEDKLVGRSAGGVDLEDEGAGLQGVVGGLIGHGLMGFLVCGVGFQWS